MGSRDSYGIVCRRGCKKDSTLEKGSRGMADQGNVEIPSGKTETLRSIKKPPLAKDRKR